MNALTLPLTKTQALPNISDHPLQFILLARRNREHSNALRTRQGDGGYDSVHATKSSTTVAGLNSSTTVVGLNAAGLPVNAQNEEVVISSPLNLR
jgi:hypothetical protein